jgi:hypothetical protein
MGSKQTSAGRSPAKRVTKTAVGRTGLGSQSVAAGRQSRPRQSITPEQRHHMIAEAAYFRALRRGFRGDAEMRDWLEAEVEVDARLQSG